ncbi:MAG TPA: translation initiation factor IF-2 [Hypericibacter adhaerens]|uniref:Translation initiation factor IF-2 n=1 Tax=Hypericibacter adhaerens TaxID=2602016 RepID=A0A5J6NBB2_9PROT|nr:translation initiation factor IF-2 [Hypericibacter adhaerens]QEX25306.1 translation initiation factor IF-2 [Hypericibacter adhaerens]HWA43474.1 translation initiation factor IF-2 [Hypericibacter adhaerens]
MTSSNDTDASKKPLKLSRPKLELKKTVDAGQVRQSFPHGRTKTVAVEVKRKRTYARGNGDKVTEVTTEPELTAPADGHPHGHAPAVAEAPAPATVAHHLTDSERAVRLKVLGEAKRDDELRRQMEQETARQRAEEEARLAAEEAARPKPKPEPEPAAAVESAAAPAAAKAAKPAPASEREAEAKPHRLTAKPAAAAAPMAEEEESDRARRPGAVRHAVPKPAPVARRDEPRRRTGKMTISQALDEDAGERVRSLAAVRRAREKERRLAMAAGDSTKVIRDVIIPETITVQELANRMAERGADVIKALMKMGIMATINQTLDADTAELVAGEFGHRVRRVSAADVEIGVEGLADEAEHMVPRWPVVTVMGHVDHGKTSLLDALRQTDVAAHEAGGITQHIGAYQVTRPNGQKITFIDTPGHAAFTEMRARGANVTDIVVLVVAADDGIMEQTVEAIHHAKAAKVPIIVAINKIDKPEANPERVRQELLKHELVVEELGGDVQTVEVSAKTRQGLDKLEEAILLQAEILELKANPDRAASGAVIEAKLERGRGVVATLLVQRGTLRVGDILVAGGEWGRVRALLDDRGEPMTEAGPSTPAEILGLQAPPLAGDTFAVVETEAKARQVSEYRQRVQRDKEAATRVRGSAQDIFAKIAEGEAKELPVIVKGDVQGSIEAIVASLQGLGTKEVAVRVLHTAVGGINESDITLARASNAMIIGFNVRANPQAREMAKRDKIEIRYYSIIYNVVDDVKAALSGLLAPTMRESFLGYAAIREVFNISKVGKVAGCMVTEGVVKRGAKVRLLRDNVVIHEGSLKTLKRFKDEVREVKEGFECGMAFENYDNIQVGDQIECFEIEQVTRTLA